jgi:hypothetical protein
LADARFLRRRHATARFHHPSRKHRCDAGIAVAQISQCVCRGMTMTMKLRYGPTATVLSALLVILGSSSIGGATTVSATNGGGSTPKERGALMAQTNPTAVEPSRGAVAPAERTGTRPLPPRVTATTTNFGCSSTQCTCKGAADCYNLGTKGLCNSTTWACSGANCVCDKKQ